VAFVRFIPLAMAITLSSPVLAQSENPILAEARAADAMLIEAQSSGDLKAMAEMIADDYVYIDVGGSRIDKAKILSRREGDHLSLSNIVDSEEEAVILSPVTVLLRGKSEGTAYYFGGLPRTGATRWSAIWRKDPDGRWRVVAEQTTVVQQKQVDPPTVKLSAAEIAAHAGRWQLATEKPMDMVLKADETGLKASIAGQFDDMLFRPSASGRYFNSDRPFELRFSPDGRTLTFVSWGSETAGRRVDGD
jgi:ketosteroid isomerase-like protein